MNEPVFKCCPVCEPQKRSYYKALARKARRKRDKRVIKEQLSQ